MRSVSRAASLTQKKTRKMTGNSACIDMVFLTAWNNQWRNGGRGPLDIFGVGAPVDCCH